MMDGADPYRLPPRRSMGIRAFIASCLVLAVLALAVYFLPLPWKPLEAALPPVEVRFTPAAELPASPVIAEEPEAPPAIPEAEPVTALPAPAPEPSPLQLASLPGPEQSFLGITDTYRRVVIAFDVADSVRRKALQAGIPLERVRDETVALVNQLDERSAFTLIQFVRRYDAFSQGFLPATQENRQAAFSWLQQRFKTDGRSAASWKTGDPDGIQLVLQAALFLDPEILFIISDGDFQRTSAQSRQVGEDVAWKDIEEQIARWQQERQRLVRVHFVGLRMDEEHRNAARRLVSRFGGQLRLID